MANRQKPSAKLLPNELHALKIVSKKAEKLRDKLTVGTGQCVDFTIRVVGAIDVGAKVAFDSDLRPELPDVLAIILGSIGPGVQRTLSNALEAAYANTKGDEQPKASDAAREAAKGLIESITRRVKKSQRGAVVGSLRIERLGK
jgi:hypothetical protein